MRILILTFISLITINSSLAHQCSELLNPAKSVKKIKPINLGISKEDIKVTLLEVYDKLGPDRASTHFDWWRGRVNLESDLNKLKINQRTEKLSWQKPQIILKGQSMMMSLVLYKGHIFAGNYFQSKSATISEEAPIGRGVNYHKLIQGQKAIELLPNNRWKMVQNASLRILNLLVEDGVFTLFRGLSRFQFDIQHFIKTHLLEKPNNQVLAANKHELTKLINSWGRDPVYEHNLNASESNFPIWKAFLSDIKEQADLTNIELIEMLNNAFTSSVQTVNEYGREKIVLNRMGTFVTPDISSAFHWAFDSISKFETGVVAKYVIDLSEIKKEDLKDIYFGIEEDYVEIGFFGHESKNLLTSTLTSEPLLRDSDPRASPLWLKKYDEWSTLYDNPIVTRGLNVWDQ